MQAQGDRDGTPATSPLAELTTALDAAATPREVATALFELGLVATGAATAHLFWRGRGEGLTLVASWSDGAPSDEPGRRVVAVRSRVLEADRAGAPVWTHACAAVPIVVNGATAGVLAVESARAPAFGAEERRYLVCMASLCAQALHRVRLAAAEAESRRRAEEAEDLARRVLERAAVADQLAGELADARTEADAAWVAFDHAAERLAAVAGVVTTATGDGELEVEHGFGCPPDVDASSARPARGGPHAFVVRTGAALWLPAAPEVSPQFPALVNALRLRGGAWTCVPLWVDGEPRGTISLTLSPAPGGAPERAAIERIVEQYARAIARARAADAERAARSAREAAEAEVRRLGSLQAELGAVVAHELRAPLAAIERCRKTLFADAEPTEAQRTKLARISACLDHVSSLLHDFTRARATCGVPLARGRVELESLVRRAVAEAEDAHPGREIRTSLEGDLVVVGDGGRLLQVLSTLIVDAVRHGSADGPVTVAVRGERAAVTIAVHDPGPSVPPCLVPHVLDASRQAGASRRRPKVTGTLRLGLFLVRELVHAHGGTVSVDSGAERGTTFTVVVPRLPTFSSPGPTGGSGLDPCP